MSTTSSLLDYSYLATECSQIFDEDPIVATCVRAEPLPCLTFKDNRGQTGHQSKVLEKFGPEYHDLTRSLSDKAAAIEKTLLSKTHLIDPWIRPSTIMADLVSLLLASLPKATRNDHGHKSYYSKWHNIRTVSDACHTLIYATDGVLMLKQLIRASIYSMDHAREQEFFEHFYGDNHTLSDALISWESIHPRTNGPIGDSKWALRLQLMNQMLDCLSRESNLENDLLMIKVEADLVMLAGIRIMDALVQEVAKSQSSYYTTDVAEWFDEVVVAKSTNECIDTETEELQQADASVLDAHETILDSSLSNSSDAGEIAIKLIPESSQAVDNAYPSTYIENVTFFVPSQQTCVQPEYTSAVPEITPPLKRISNFRSAAKRAIKQLKSKSSKPELSTFKETFGEDKDFRIVVDSMPVVRCRHYRRRRSSLVGVFSRIGR